VNCADVIALDAVPSERAKRVSPRANAVSEPRERSGDRRGPRERACRGVRGAKPLG